MLGLLFPRELPDIRVAGTLAIFFVLVVAADLNPVVLAGGALVTVGTAINLTNAILFGPGWAVVLAAASVVVTELMLRRPWYKILFNSMGSVVWVGLAAMAYQAVHDPAAMPLGSYQNLAAILAYALVDFVFNSILVSLILGLSQRLSPFHVWGANLEGVILQFATMAPLGVLIAATYRQTSIVGAMLLVLPLIVVYVSFRTLQHLREQTLKTVEALADAVDRRDAYTAQHSEVVSEYCRKLAIKMGLPLQEVEAIVLAARVHDLGKIAVPDSVLLKPGKLDADEWETMQEHPSVGADILGKLWLYRRSREFVLYHQERYDGKGYPTGIAGDEIPLGARIISVVDAY
ncbi:MAG: HD domain-containing protein, partial [Chloroflexota bacterium]